MRIAYPGPQREDQSSEGLFHLAQRGAMHPLTRRRADEAQAKHLR
jgi:hypothetical protein